ncbi:ATP-binding protein [Microcoleus sp. FACHB-831]|uniref:ATP-binding protein n=1 Tax=Microcoleus sp. FACHB-831 TaxID=2692827 RepID=UPI002816829F|nr:ATP-binding protein [Microcoleus sp. FACHB-831]
MALFDDRPLQQSRLQVQTDLNALANVLQWFEQFNLPPVSQEMWYKCQLVLVEGFTNAVRHAHQDLPLTTPIDIEVTLFNDWLEMRIWDWGQPFDLATKLKSLPDPPHDPGTPGGRGLIYMQQLNDELYYERISEQQNCLVMRKRIK